MTTERRPLVLISNCGPRNTGGVETFLRTLISQAQSEQVPVIWYYSRKSLERLDQDNLPPPNIVTRTYYQNSQQILQRFLSLKPTSEIISDFHQKRPQAVVFNGQPRDWLIPLIPIIQQSSKTSFIFHGDVHKPPELNHTNPIKYLGRKFLNWRLQHFIDSPQTQIICVSDFVAQRAKTVYGQNLKTQVHYPPTVPDNCQYTDFNQPLVGTITTVSRISPEKNLQLVPKISKACHDLGLPFKFQIVGGAHNSDYHQQITNQCQGLVELVGPKHGPEICQVLNKTDLCLDPSRNEGFGLTTVEALMHAKPVIGLAQAFKEILNHFPSPPGLIPNTTDEDETIKDIVTYLEAFSTNPELRRQQRETAYQARKIFDPHRLIQEIFQSVYQ